MRRGKGIELFCGFFWLCACSLALAGALPSRTVGTLTVPFPAQSDIVGDRQRDELRALVAGSGPLDRVIVVAWGDVSSPAPGAHLSESEVSLAEDRARSVGRLLRGLGVAEVDLHNLATAEDWVAQDLRMPLGELKSVFAKRGMETPPVTEAELQAIRRAGGPGAVVVVPRPVAAGVR